MPGCSADVAVIISAAGIPKGLFSDLPIDMSKSPALIANPLVRAVTLTGREAAGRAVVKTCTMLIGTWWESPYLVLEDANLGISFQRCVASRMFCAGQVCIAAKRIIVAEQIYDQFRDLLLKELDPYVMSDPAKAGCRLGPLARKDLRTGFMLR